MPDVTTQEEIDRLASAFDEARAFLDAGQRVIQALIENPDDDQCLRNVMAMLEALRDNHDEVVALRKSCSKLRNLVMATVYDLRRDVRIQELADTAGVNTSYVSRVAEAHGVPKRTERPPRGQAKDGDQATQPQPAGHSERS